MAIKSNEYTPDEMQKLHRSAEHLLGWEVIFNKLHVPADAGTGIGKRILDSRGKVAIAISEIDFYPTQDKAWQAKIDQGTSDENKRKPLQVFTGFTQGNPLVSVVLQRGPNAKSDPLAVIKRVIAATGKTADEFSWKKLLTDKSLGLTSDQLLAATQAMNFSDLKDADAPVQLRKIQGLRPDREELDAPEDAHEDLQSKMKLTADTKQKLGHLLIEMLREQQ